MKRLSGLIVVTILGLGLAWMGTAQAGEKIKEILDRGALRACHAEALPWGYKDPRTEEWVGTDIEASKHLAETMGVAIEHIDATWGTLIPSLETNKCDVVMAPMFRTPERAMRVLFADPHGFETQAVAVSSDSDLQSYADVDQEGHTVAVISGTADEAFALKFFENAEVRALVTDKLSTIFLEVASDRADAVLTDTSTLNRFIDENPAMDLRVLDEKPVNPQGYSYAVLPDYYHFREFINVWLKHVQRAGLPDEWYEKYADFVAEE